MNRWRQREKNRFYYTHVRWTLSTNMPWIMTSSSSLSTVRTLKLHKPEPTNVCPNSHQFWYYIFSHSKPESKMLFKTFASEDTQHTHKPSNSKRKSRAKCGTQKPPEARTFAIVTMSYSCYTQNSVDTLYVQVRFLFYFFLSHWLLVRPHFPGVNISWKKLDT